MDVITGRLTTLHDLTVYDGSHPETELIQANDGAFYGAASAGVPNFGGVIFRVRLATSPPDGYSRSCRATAASVSTCSAHRPTQAHRRSSGSAMAVRINSGGSSRPAAARFGSSRATAARCWTSLVSVDDVAPMIQWPAHGGDNQAWTLEPASDGYVLIVARHSGKVMDVNSPRQRRRTGDQVHSSRWCESAMAPPNGVDTALVVKPGRRQDSIANAEVREGRGDV